MEPGTELVTPLSNRPFRVRETSADRLQIRFDDSGEKRVLWREQFEVLTDRLQEHRLAIVDLSPGVEPYATVLTLLADVVVENDEIASVSEREMGAGSPYLISPAEARTRPERLHDGAILLADLLDTLDSVDPDTLETGAR